MASASESNRKRPMEVRQSLVRLKRLMRGIIRKESEIETKLAATSQIASATVQAVSPESRFHMTERLAFEMMLAIKSSDHVLHSTNKPSGVKPSKRRDILKI